MSNCAKFSNVVIQVSQSLQNFIKLNFYNQNTIDELTTLFDLSHYHCDIE